MDVVVSFPELLVLLPQVEDAVCNPKVTQSDTRPRQRRPPGPAVSSGVRRWRQRAGYDPPPTFELGDLQLLDLLQFPVALPVLVQLAVVVVALGLVLVLQVVVLLLQILMLVLAGDTTRVLR